VKSSAREVFTERLFGPLETATGPAVVGDEVVNYPELLRRAETLRRSLRAAGLRGGMRVGICLDPSAEYVIAISAVLQAGSTALMLSPSWTEREVGRCLELIDPSFLLTNGTSPQSIPPRAVISTPLPGLSVLDCRRDDQEPSLPQDAVIIFTSGTSGVPKGVVLTGDGLFSNVSAVREYLEVSESDSSPLFTPTCYAYAVSQVLVQLLAGAAICPIKHGLRYPILILEAIERFRLRGMSANPTSFKILLKTAEREKLDLSSLRYAMGGGQFLARDVVDAMQRRFTNSRVVNQYGCTENSPRICYHWVRDNEQPLPGKSLPVGKAVRGTELIVAGSDGVPVPHGEVGQVLVRGTSLMRGYWNMPAETEARFVKGWFQTGDLGILDPEGNLVLIGRLSDSINVGNEKVHPGEIEGYIQELPSIQEAAVFGASDPLFGEVVEAVVVPADGVPLDSGDATLQVREHLKHMVSAYKIPRRVHIASSLPRNLYGKLDRKRLQEWVAPGPRAHGV